MEEIGEKGRKGRRRKNMGGMKGVVLKVISKKSLSFSVHAKTRDMDDGLTLAQDNVNIGTCTLADIPKLLWVENRDFIWG